MSRFTHALLFSTLAAACGPTVNQSVCDGSVTQPEECSETCNAAPGSPNTCPAGFYCTEDGTCNAQCAPGVKECPDGYVCTSDGRCEDDGNDDVPPPDTENCPNVTFQAMPVTPSIGLVLDRSGSMYDEPDFVNHRYRQMRDALVGPSGVVAQLESKAYFGSLLYTGTQATPVCPEAVVVPRAINNANAIRASMDQFLNRDTHRGGNTPTPDAVNAMVASFQANPPPTGSPPVIVLATDGLPNTCANNQANTQTQSVAAVAAAKAAGIPVYVLAIGLTGQHFQDLAEAGQDDPNAVYYQANNAQQLADAFQTIINGVVSCELSLDAELSESQAAQGTVTLNGMDLTYGTDWELASPTTIRLLGAACDTLKTTTNPTVNAEFPCGVIVGKSVR